MTIATSEAGLEARLGDGLVLAAFGQSAWLPASC